MCEKCVRKSWYYEAAGAAAGGALAVTGAAGDGAGAGWEGGAASLCCAEGSPHQYLHFCTSKLCQYLYLPAARKEPPSAQPFL